jgi:hypothetical protein
VQHPRAPGLVEHRRAQPRLGADHVLGHLLETGRGLGVMFEREQRRGGAMARRIAAALVAPAHRGLKGGARVLRHLAHAFGIAAGLDLLSGRRRGRRRQGGHDQAGEDSGGDGKSSADQALASGRGVPVQSADFVAISRP